MSNSKETICPIPWLSLSTESQRQFRLCCHETGEEPVCNSKGGPVFLESVESASEVYNTELYQRVRRQMLNGQRPSMCQGCFDREDLTGESPRKEYLKRFEKTFEKVLPATDSNGEISIFQTAYLDVTVDNHCNLKCRMCRPRYSAKIEDDWKKMGWVISEDETRGISSEKTLNLYRDSQVIDEILSSVEMVTMTGGEPLLSESVDVLIQRLIDKNRCQDVELRFFTNATVFPEKMKEKLEKFKSVTFFCSIDGQGKTSDYIRYPAKWSTIDRVFTKLINWQRESSNIFVFVHTVLQAYNITQIVELFKYLKSFDGQTPILPSITHVESSIPLKIHFLPKKILEKTRDEIQIFLNESKNDMEKYHRQFHERESQNILSLLDDAIENNQGQFYIDFVIYSKKMDKIRHQSFEQTYPEFQIANTPGR